MLHEGLQFSSQQPAFPFLGKTHHRKNDGLYFEKESGWEQDQECPGIFAVIQI